MRAELIYDGSMMPKNILGEPRHDQLQGTAREVVAELCGRICYDSLGQGRSSEQYHKHIKEVAHLSTYEHTPLTYVLLVEDMSVYPRLLNILSRRGINVENIGDNKFEISISFRALIEHSQYKDNKGRAFFHKAIELGRNLAPQILGEPEYYPLNDCTLFVTEPTREANQWISIYMQGSRGFSHEQVRHRFAISQRSTRYVDESESDWEMHPLIYRYLDTQDDDLIQRDKISLVESSCRDLYDNLVKELQEFLIKQKVDKLSARKQARGAARGYLGNALSTEMIFSAPVEMWHRLIKQRCSRFADAEIRSLYCEHVLPALKSSIYGHKFEHYKLTKSPDGIGWCLDDN